jgi:hypothetical protein
MSMSEQGDGYIVVTRDDGSSFGQNVRGCKAQTANEMDTFVLSLLDEIDEITNADFVIDQIESLADSECPIYYGDIITQWTQLGNDDSNEFGEIMTPDQNTTIYDLMSADLWLYYKREFLSVYNEILDEQESEQN